MWNLCNQTLTSASGDGQCRCSPESSPLDGRLSTLQSSHRSLSVRCDLGACERSWGPLSVTLNTGLLSAQGWTKLRMHSRWSCNVSITMQLTQLSDVLGKNSLKGRCDALQGVVCISDKTTWACSVLFVIPPSFPGARKHFCIMLPNSMGLQTGKIQALPGPGFEVGVLDHVNVYWLPALLHSHLKEMRVKEETNVFWSV